MRPITRWQHFMSSIVTVEPRSSNDGYGKPTYGAAVTYPAHIGRGRHLVRTAAGQEVESEQTVHLSTATAILPTARITLSTGDVGSTEAASITPTIIAVDRLFDGGGAHHVVIHLAWLLYAARIGSAWL